MSIETVGKDVWEISGEDAGQDYLNGAALRRLQKALPEGLCIIKAEWLDPDVWEPPAFRVSAGGEFGAGSTFAEAADECREALP